MAVTAEEFMQKASWEGGWTALADYGIDDEEVPVEIRSEWQAFVGAYDELLSRHEALVAANPEWAWQL